MFDRSQTTGMGMLNSLMGGGFMSQLPAFHGQQQLADRMNALQGFQGDLSAWRQDRPVMGADQSRDAYRQALDAYHAQRPTIRGALRGTNPAAPPATTPNPVQTNPGAPVGQVPQLPPQMNALLPGNVGSSYGVIGAHPATNPFGLPTY